MTRLRERIELGCAGSRSEPDWAGPLAGIPQEIAALTDYLAAMVAPAKPAPAPVAVAVAAPVK